MTDCDKKKKVQGKYNTELLKKVFSCTNCKIIILVTSNQCVDLDWLCRQTLNQDCKQQIKLARCFKVIQNNFHKSLMWHTFTRHLNSASSLTGRAACSAYVHVFKLNKKNKGADFSDITSTMMSVMLENIHIIIQEVLFQHILLTQKSRIKAKIVGPITQHFDKSIILKHQ